MGLARTCGLSAMNLQSLRVVLRPQVVALKDRATHETLPSVFSNLELPLENEGSKREKMEKSFDSVADVQLPRVAERLFVNYPLPASVRNQIQDLLWEDSPLPEIPKKAPAGAGEIA